MTNARPFVACLLLSALALTAVAAEQEHPLTQLQGDVERVTTANQAFQYVFGPVPAIAASPFLGLALLTGAALVAGDSSSNSMIVAARSYASWWLFAVFLVLAILTAAANSGKLHGSVGKLVHVAEATLVTAAYVMLVGYGMFSAPSHVASASFLPGTLVITAALTMIPIVVVRLAFDVLIWLNPVPFIDLFFQIGKTAFALVFFLIYLVSPVAAAILAVLFFVPALLMFPWAMRLLGFTWQILIRPLLTPLFPLFGTSVQTEPALFCRGHVLRARGFKKRQAVELFARGDAIVVQPSRRPGSARSLMSEGEQVMLARTFAWIEVRVVAADGRVLDQVALPYSVAKQYDALLRSLRAADAGRVGVLKAIDSALAILAE